MSAGHCTSVAEAYGSINDVGGNVSLVESRVGLSLFTELGRNVR